MSDDETSEEGGKTVSSTIDESGKLEVGARNDVDRRREVRGARYCCWWFVGVLASVEAMGKTEAFVTPS